MKLEIANPERFKVSHTTTGGLRVDLGGMLVAGSTVTDTEKFNAMVEVKQALEAQGATVEVRFNNRSTDGVYRPWPHLFGNPPKVEGASASDVADLKAQLAHLTALLAAGVTPVVAPTEQVAETPI